MKNAINSTEIAVAYAIARTGNRYVGKSISEINDVNNDLVVIDDIELAAECDDFIESIKFYARRISMDTDVQIVEYHHNQKKDAPSGTALMIKEALISANPSINKDKVLICSIRGGNIFGEHEVIFANCKDEVVTYKHQVSSREPFVDGAVEVSKWIVNQSCGLYNMDDFCN